MSDNTQVGQTVLDTVIDDADPIEKANRQPEKWQQFAEAFAAASGELENPPTNRTAKVASDKGNYQFSYADLPSVLETVRKTLAKHKLVVLQTFSLVHDPAIGPTVYMRTGLVHGPSGAGISPNANVTPWPVGSTKPQAIGSVVTYSRRYSLVTMLGIAADDDDDANVAEGNAAEVTPKQHGGGASSPSGKLATPAQVKFLDVEITKAKKRASETDIEPPTHEGIVAFVNAKHNLAMKTLNDLPIGLVDSALAHIRSIAN